MKILFYLPVVTPWWFETIITPMLHALHDEAELHIIVAPLWNNTGLEAGHVEPLADLPGINWHIVDADDPAQFRLDGAAVDGLLELVRDIDPDITLARSADRATPALFPGTVRHIMEPGAWPFHTPHRWFVLDEQPFHYGDVPAHAITGADQAAGLMAPYWAAIEAHFAEAQPGDLRRKLGLPLDRPILAVPLQYEHEENFYAAGSPLRCGPQFLRDLLAQLDERVMLAVTDHPLNTQYLKRADLHLLAIEFPDRVRILEAGSDRHMPTSLLIRAADAVLVDRSKCVTLAAFFGTPIVHAGDSVMAPWMNATHLDRVLADGPTDFNLPRPDPDAARRWFGWHFGMRLTNFNEVTLGLLQDRISGGADEAAVAELLAFVARWLDASVEGAETIVAAFAQRKRPGQIAA